MRADRVDNPEIEMHLKALAMTLHDAIRRRLVNLTPEEAEVIGEELERCTAALRDEMKTVRYWCNRIIHAGSIVDLPSLKSEPKPKKRIKKKPPQEPPTLPADEPPHPEDGPNGPA